MFFLPRSKDVSKGPGGFTGPEVRERRASFRSHLSLQNTYLVRIGTYLVTKYVPKYVSIRIIVRILIRFFLVSLVYCLFQIISRGASKFFRKAPVLIEVCIVKRGSGLLVERLHGASRSPWQAHSDAPVPVFFRGG